MRIKQAAILHEGKIWEGRRHHQIIADLVKAGAAKPVKSPQGFVTECGKFVDRTEGERIAREAGQITKLIGSVLTSEDLY